MSTISQNEFFQLQVHAPKCAIIRVLLYFWCMHLHMNVCLYTNIGAPAIFNYFSKRAFPSVSTCTEMHIMFKCSQCTPAGNVHDVPLLEMSNQLQKKKQSLWQLSSEEKAMQKF